ncbi:hypothetical protein ACD578_15760 [Microvirga sp. RSM25]|uniref:hypothetical protein n=1 Tax=Microvirga sp. RSM25 TaxID=3273802 RepID=UPI00384B540D
MRILILEDDPWIATDLQSILEAEGHEIVDSLGSLDEAYRHLDDEFDCALLDIDVIGGKSFGVAEALIERQIPFVFVSAPGLSTCLRPFGKPPLSRSLSRNGRFSNPWSISL